MNRREFLGATAGILGSTLIPINLVEGNDQPIFKPPHDEVTFLVEDIDEILAVKNFRDIYTKRAGFAFAATCHNKGYLMGDCAAQFIPYPKQNGTLISTICAPIDARNVAFDWVFSIDEDDNWTYRKRTILEPFSKKELKFAAEIVQFRDEKLQFWSDHPELWVKNCK